MVLEYVHMVVSQLNVKGEQKIHSLKKLHSSSQIFVFEIYWPTKTGQGNVNLALVLTFPWH